MLNILTVFVGGGIGAVLRYVFSLAITKMFYVSFLGTLCVNIVGCFFIGFISGFFLQKYGVVNSTLKIFLTVGILGGFTTFSSFGLETFELLKMLNIYLQSCIF